MCRLNSALRLSALGLTLSAFLFLFPRTWAASFDTGLSPEATRDLLLDPGLPAVPAGSWLRLRDLEHSTVRDDTGAEVSPWKEAKPTATLAARREALAALRARGYHLVAMVRWPSASWNGGVRPDQPLRRLPVDLREAHERCRRLAEAYGDLIDYWEIENEPDISFVEENPETYAAFLKACYLGFKMKPETGNLKPESDHPPGSDKRTQVSGLSSQVSASARSRVLMAAFALPPGPYFDAWVANDGLRYTDGFNYHYYGYAEDFTGVYRQFEHAVTNARPVAAADEAVLQTRFYPAGTGWQPRLLAEFSGDGARSKANREWLQARPFASEEPALHARGRWLISNGTTVREIAEGWEFTVASPADGPLRPAMAELPLPDGWTAPVHASLAFEYRIQKPETGDRKPEVMQETSPVDAGGKYVPAKTQAARISYAEFSGLRSPVSALAAARLRELPVFLTEYGYGLLDKEARSTSAGREAQRAWFAAVRSQINTLKIEGPMAFILRPYLEAGKNEFGLLMEAPLRGTDDGRQMTDKVGHETENKRQLADGPEPPQVSGFRSQVSKKGYAVSPALAELLQPAAAPYTPKSWTVALPLPIPVVMDFVGGAGLQMSKSHRGYVLQEENAAAQLIVYQFGSKPVSGELVLEGDTWALAGGNRRIRLTLAPGERREINLAIHPAEVARFGSQAATARFVIGGPPVVPPPQPLPLAPAKATPPPVVVTPPVTTPLPPGQELEIYFRTQNGNLYQTWPRLQARETWQWYAEPLANFTSAFFGRAHLPTALAENKPAALVLFFRPEKYPTTYVIRHAQVVEYVAAPQKTEGR